jgi:hypothetical protein
VISEINERIREDAIIPALHMKVRH